MQGLRLSSTLGDAVAVGFEQPKGLDWTLEGYLINENPKEGHHKQVLNKEFRNTFPASNAICFQFSLAEVWSVFPDKIPVADPAVSTLAKAMDPEILLAWLEGEGLKKYDKLLI